MNKNAINDKNHLEMLWLYYKILSSAYLENKILLLILMLVLIYGMIVNFYFMCGICTYQALGIQDESSWHASSCPWVLCKAGETTFVSRL